jgi:hypothetical protein
MTHLLAKLALLTMLVQSFVVANVIKGLVPSYVFILLQLIKDSFAVFVRRLPVNVFPAVMTFLLGFAAYQMIGQLGNALFPPSFAALPARVLVSTEDPSQGLFRMSLFTQSMYLLTSVIFFLYIYKLLKLPLEADRIMRWAQTGVLLYVAYGFVEFFGFLLTGGSIDIISNRITGIDSHYGTFQTIRLGGVTIERMKSLAGEPSMFAFSVIPFFILAYYRRRKIAWLLLAAAVLSTSTTALLGLVLFLIIEGVWFKRFFKTAAVVAVGVTAVLVIFPQAIQAWYAATAAKLTLQTASGIDRFENFSSALTLFGNTDFLHRLFGHGFGYIRSTDGFSTLLANTGVVGFLAYSAFFLFPLFRLRYDSGYHRGLLAATVVLYVTIMVSVPEFYYLHVWFFAALVWREYMDRAESPAAGAYTGAG